MDFFKINRSDQTAYVPGGTQIKAIHSGVNYWDERNVIQVDYNFEGMPAIQTVELASRAKQTDVLSGGNLNFTFCMIVSKRFLDLLSSFKVVKHNIFPVEVHKKEKIIPGYYFVKWNQSIEEYIDLNTSRFVVYDTRGKERRQVTLSQEELLTTLYGKTPALKEVRVQSSLYLMIDTLTLNKDFDLDLFSLGRFYESGLYVSKRLKLAMEETRIIGLEFEESSFIQVN